MDDADRVVEIEAREAAIAKKLPRVAPRLRGPEECNACGALNDRADEGYAICTYCKCARR